MTINKSEFKVVIKNGGFFVKHTFNGENFQDVDFMKIYGLNAKPYIKRLGEKMYLPEALVRELKEVA